MCRWVFGLQGSCTECIIIYQGCRSSGRVQTDFGQFLAWRHFVCLFLL